MNWIAFTGLATAFTGIAILITVFIGIRQLRHLQTATQLDGTLRLLDFNPAMERLTGWREGEVLGRFYFEILRPKDRQGNDLGLEDSPILQVFAGQVVVNTIRGDDGAVVAGAAVVVVSLTLSTLWTSWHMAHAQTSRVPTWIPSTLWRR